ncbi:MAG: DNA-binding protein [Betaproteobacteria bacterium]|nr:DNA-binding protein [Betaproteobacteria bacterium]
MEIPPLSLPLPLVRPETRAFWTGGARGELMIHRCGACSRLHHPPLPICPHCQDDGVAPCAVSGRARIVSFTVNHQKWRPDMTEPYVVAYVELDEQQGLWLLTNVINAPPENLLIGQRVKVLFVQREDVWLPLFEPDPA